MWSYYSLVVGNLALSGQELDVAFNELGAEGWEMVAGLTTVKSWSNLTGNRLVFVFKHPGDVRPPAAVVARYGRDAPYGPGEVPPSDGTW